ncbi:hypothetical protein BDV19DRAFT_367741 [Aspergillus venezuelensis]
MVCLGRYVGMQVLVVWWCGHPALTRITRTGTRGRGRGPNHGWIQIPARGLYSFHTGNRNWGSQSSLYRSSICFFCASQTVIICIL